ncbi:MAG: DUF4159 domain-containing protein [Planctomycetes bacterium]|jgi:hypothetical protein|nr:DUF4159 domain-containing protein [Planctomycetota bacterium]
MWHVCAKQGGICLVTVLAMSLARPAPCPAGDVPLTPATIDAAIEGGREYLLGLQNMTADDANYGSWIEPGWEPDADDADSGTDESASAGSPVWARYNVGNTALMTYALIESGMSPNDRRIKAALDWLVASQKQAGAKRDGYLKVLGRLLKMPGQIGVRSDDYQRLQALERDAFECTYNVAFRAMAFDAAARVNPKYRPHMRRDAEHLVRGLVGGAYGYVCIGNNLLLKKLSKRRTSIEDVRRMPEMFVDHSNSQYGVLGAWTGSLKGVEVPRGYWKQVETYWKTAQNRDGGWGYTAPPRREIRTASYPAMTAAGIATLYITHDQLHAREFVGCGGNEMDAQLTRALTWFGQNFARTMDPEATFSNESGSPAYGLNYYYLYGVERIGLACGYRTFGGVDWFRTGAEYILDKQYQSGKWKGSWTGKWVDGWRPGATAYAMLFLIRGKEPVYVARLQHDGDWNNRPRALANVSRYLGRLLETRGHWQIVRMDTAPEAWHDAPVLVVTGSRDPRFTPEQIDKLRAYIQQGGTVLTIAEGGGRPFTEAVEAVCEEIIPGRDLADAPADHAVYSALGRLTPGQPSARMVDNGVRPLWIHVDKDIARSWQLQQAASRKGHFMFAANLLFHLRGGRWPQRSLNDWPAAVEVDGEAARVTTLLWDGNANPEPLAMRRFSRRVGAREGLNVEVLDPLDAADLEAGAVDVAVLTGTGELKLTDAQRQTVKAFVEAGGVLLATAAGGDVAFHDSARTLLGEMFAEPRALAVDHPIYAAKGWEIGDLELTRAARKRMRETPPRLEAIDVDGRTAVLLSRDDIIAGLLGCQMQTIDGYRPQTAEAMMRNILIATAGAETGKVRPAVSKASQTPVERNDTDKADDTDEKANLPDGVVDWQDAADCIGKEATIQGRVVTAKNHRGRIVFLNFRRDRAKSLTAVIKADDFGKFPRRPAEFYRGKLVRVTGKVKEYKGAPEIELTSAKQIKVIDE